MRLHQPRRRKMFNPLPALAMILQHQTLRQLISLRLPQGSPFHAKTIQHRRADLGVVIGRLQYRHGRWRLGRATSLHRVRTGKQIRQKLEHRIYYSRSSLSLDAMKQHGVLVFSIDLAFTCKRPEGPCSRSGANSFTSSYTRPKRAYPYSSYSTKTIVPALDQAQFPSNARTTGRSTLFLTQAVQQSPLLLHSLRQVLQLGPLPCDLTHPQLTAHLLLIDES